jgi:hypothetical protein
MKILFSCTGIPTDVNDGDVAIVKEDYFFHFYYVVLSKCRLIETVKTIRFMQGNVKYGVVFDYSDFNPRNGIHEQLRFFINIFKKRTTVDFLQNALDILLYKEDKWDVSLLQSMAFAEECIDEKVIMYSFVDFLDEQAKNFFNKQIERGCTVSDAYRLTKTTYPIVFAQSVKRFKAVYPEKSIYD